MRQKIISIVILGLTLEKILQHGLTALFFIFDMGEIGKPDIGSRIALSDSTMAVLNCVLMGLFIWGFWDIWKLRNRGLYLVIILSVFDIIAEFVFHGFGLITVSVIVAMFLVGAIFLKLRGLSSEK